MARDGRPLTVWHVGGEDVHMRIPLLRRLREHGFNVGAVGSGDSERFRECEIPYWNYPLARWVNPVADLRAKRSLHELFVQHQPDIVHSFDTKPAILATLAAKAACIPVRIRTINGMGYTFSSQSPFAKALRIPYRGIQKVASNAANVTVFQNRDDRNYFIQHGMVRADRSELILGSGVEFGSLVVATDECRNLRRELGVSSTMPIVAMICRMVRHKGVSEYLEAARQLHAGGVNAKFILVGPLSSEGRQAISMNEINRYREDVQYLGPRDDVPAILAHCSMFVLPTYYREGVPRVLLEAAVAGLPLVTTDMPGCNEVVVNGVHGMLVPPRDAPALAVAIHKLLDSPSLRLAMGRSAREHVRSKFCLDLVADSHARIYERCYAEAHSSRLAAA